jgi:hypothetical protein
MASDSEQRIIRLEMMLGPILRRLASVEITAGRAGQVGGGGSGGGGGGGMVKFKITETLPGILAGTSTTPSSGSAVYEDWDGIHISDLGTTDVLWNEHDKGFATGAVVSAYTWRGAWWIFDVDSCLNLF